MIHQFAEIGQYYLEHEGVRNSGDSEITLYVQDPKQKFRTENVLLMVFSQCKPVSVQIEQYDDSKKLWYLYRAGQANGFDATPTSGIRQIKRKSLAELEREFSNEVRKKLARLERSIADALDRADELPEERTGLETMRDILKSAIEDSEASKSSLAAIVAQLQTLLPHQPGRSTVVSQDAILSIAWQMDSEELKHVGDFRAFRSALVHHGSAAASTKKGIEGPVKGIGQCSICGKVGSEVSGLLQIPNFKLYTLDKPGSVSGGFDPSLAWRNFPACRECCERVDFSGDRVKKNLAFDYYGFKYLFLPSPVLSIKTLTYEFLDRLISARVNRPDIKRLTAAEDEILYLVAQEQNQLQVDLLFYQPDPQSFRPALYVSGLVPTRFRKVFDAKDCVDAHPWFREPSPRHFIKNQFTFGSLRNVFPAAHGGSTFDDDFLAATRAALELRRFPTQRMLHIGMRWVQQDYRDGKPWHSRLADLFRCIRFFEQLTNSNTEGGNTIMKVDYGQSGQAQRVRAVLDQASGRLQTDAAAQAAFLVGACCSRIETIQAHVRGSSPFSGKLKGFRLNQADVQNLFVAAKDKAKAYGPEEETKVNGLLECAATALAATSERWPLSADEVSYFFALGHALRPRFAKEATDSNSAS